MVKLLEKELSFEEKQKIVRTVVEKVEAVPAEATIYGRIPIFEGIGNDLISIKENEEKVGLNTQDSNLVKINQHITEKNAESDDAKCEAQKIFTSGQVGLNVKDRNPEFLNQPIFFIPFSIKIRLPKPKWKNIPIRKR